MAAPTFTARLRLDQPLTRRAHVTCLLLQAVGAVWLAAGFFTGLDLIQLPGRLHGVGVAALLTGVLVGLPLLLTARAYADRRDAVTAPEPPRESGTPETFIKPGQHVLRLPHGPWSPTYIGAQLKNGRPGGGPYDVVVGNGYEHHGQVAFATEHARRVLRGLDGLDTRAMAAMLHTENLLAGS